MHGQIRRLVHLLLVGMATGLLPGCYMLRNGFIDPSQLGNFGRETTIEIRDSLSIQDTPLGIPGATEPGPEDLIPVYEEYRLKVGDAMLIRIFELLARNTETATQVTVDELGAVVLPVLGEIHVNGMTRAEVTEELRKLLAERGYVKDATVIVEFTLRRGRTFTIFGATASPSLYPIPTPDSRLLEVLNMAGGFFDTVTDIYVFRKVKSSNDEFDARNRRRDRNLLATRAPYAMSGGLGQSGASSARRQPDPEPDGSAQSPEDPAPDADKQPTEAEAELLEAVEPPVLPPPDLTKPAAPAEATAPEESAPTREPPPSDESAETRPSPAEAVDEDLMDAPGAPQPRWIFVNGEWIETTEAPTATLPAPAQPGTPAQNQSPSTSSPDLDWTRLAGDEETRVIHVAAQALRDGDPRQNIVIRSGDVIRVLAGQVGEYYMMGQIIRPGAYSITGRQITLKTAIASAGNVSPLAWPERCTIYRRYGDREEMHQVNLVAIFDGREPDVLIKNNDLILVGTHPAAPFLAVARSAFRLTYGFGFVYDRNFADIDQYGPRVNPSNIPSSVGSRFPNIFR